MRYESIDLGGRKLADVFSELVGSKVIIEYGDCSLVGLVKKKGRYTINEQEGDMEALPEEIEFKGIVRVLVQTKGMFCR